jgi:histidine triad (HIT) family protein
MEEEKGCVFCDIVAGKAEAYKIYEDELSICILDIHPYTKGHCLVIAKRHVQWWHELSDEEHASLFKVATNSIPTSSFSMPGAEEFPTPISF